jgi:hypothetical protein
MDVFEPPQKVVRSVSDGLGFAIAFGFYDGALTV